MTTKMKETMKIINTQCLNEQEKMFQELVKIRIRKVEFMSKEREIRQTSEMCHRKTTWSTENACNERVIRISVDNEIAANPSIANEEEIEIRMSEVMKK